jgi:hypothetical protein
LDRLVGGEIEGMVDGLARTHSRALADNPDGTALVAEALREALHLGLDAGCRRVGRPSRDLDYGRSDAWERWQRERDRSPERGAWPADLERSAPEVIARARELVAAAGTELGLRRRARNSLADAGAQAAEAGAALARALTEPSEVPETPRAATGAALGDPQPDGTVRVAVASNQAEAELLQGVLAGADIPSTWRRTGGDLPHLLAGGYREIYVPAKAAEQAQALLGTFAAAPPDREPEPTRRIGLERTGIRLAGKLTAALIAASSLGGVALWLFTSDAVGALVLLAVLVIAVAIVVWSERSGSA